MRFSLIMSMAAAGLPLSALAVPTLSPETGLDSSNVVDLSQFEFDPSELDNFETLVNMEGEEFEIEPFNVTVPSSDHDKRALNYHCTPTRNVVVNAWRPSAPTVGDCYKITTNIGGGGKWDKPMNIGSKELVKYGSCHYDVRAYGSNFHTVSIGNGDIIRSIYAAVKYFSRNNRVAAWGEMDCGAGILRWGIYE